MRSMTKIARLAAFASLTFALHATASTNQNQSPAPPPVATDTHMPEPKSPESTHNSSVSATSPPKPPKPGNPPPARAPAASTMVNPPAPVLPSKEHKTLAATEFTSESPPGFSIGTVKTANNINRSAVALAGEVTKVWVFEDRVLSLFECGKKACVNDASGVVYELEQDAWRATGTRLRPWSTLVYVKDGQTVACIKPVVIQHSGVKAFCYAADRSWRESYFIRAPKPEICAKSLRMIQLENNQHWLTELELPSGNIKSKIAVNPPFKMLCDYKGPIKPELRLPGENEAKNQ